jgi:hypothetical protein
VPPEPESIKKQHRAAKRKPAAAASVVAGLSLVGKKLEF